LKTEARTISNKFYIFTYIIGALNNLLQIIWI
jgi:hypothetical protein